MSFFIFIASAACLRLKRASSQTLFIIKHSSVFQIAFCFFSLINYGDTQIFRSLLRHFELRCSSFHYLLQYRCYFDLLPDEFLVPAFCYPWFVDVRFGCSRFYLEVYRCSCSDYLWYFVGSEHSAEAVNDYHVDIKWYIYGAANA